MPEKEFITLPFLAGTDSGQATAVSFAVPADSAPFWAERLSAEGLDFEGPFERFGKQVIFFQDPGIRFALNSTRVLCSMARSRSC